MDARDLNAPTENPPQLILVGENLPTSACFNLATSTHHNLISFHKETVEAKITYGHFRWTKGWPTEPTLENEE